MERTERSREFHVDGIMVLMFFSVSKLDIR